MTRKEYLESLKNRPTTKSSGSCSKNHSFSTMDEYLEARRKCEAFEYGVEKDEYFTKEDYEAFDRNFKAAIETIMYKDDDILRDDIEQTIHMMEAVDWRWAEGGRASTPGYNRFLDKIKYCYEMCLEGDSPKNSCSTGGITVETDILDHYVTIRFSSIDSSAFDTDEGTRTQI